MKVGTKSLLFGVHQFLLHPFFVAAAWKQLYGFPFDPRLWIAFFVHDIGYFGKPNMDGVEGERHVLVGARIMRVFGVTWEKLALYHSRFYAARDGASPSKLCFADKLSICLTPDWLYIPMAAASGELYEYLDAYRNKTKYDGAGITTSHPRLWLLGVQRYMRRWVYEHKDGKVDTWTGKVS